MQDFQNINTELRSIANPAKAKLLAGYFKTAKGQYAEGDIFIGITVPKLREIAVKYQNLELADVQKLLKSKVHEQRFVALQILILQFNKGNEEQKKNIYNIYLANTKYINNWDLVDTSAHKIIGSYLYNKDKKVIYKLAKSKLLWERRIAILATFYFISKGQFKDALEIANILLKDKHDLIHKAVGWMLREVGKRNLSAELRFLKQHAGQMPRTMLRYAIEKFPPKERQKFLAM